MFELFREFRRLCHKLIGGTGGRNDTSLYFLIKYRTVCESGFHNVLHACFARFQHCITSVKMSCSFSKETLGIVWFLKVGWKWMVLFLFCSETYTSHFWHYDRSHYACSEILPKTFLKHVRPQITRQITDFLNSVPLFNK
jgi:hypothetical protein